MQDPYQVLGITPNATDDEIKDAYRKLAKKYHPDLNQDKEYAEKMMKEINLAYDTIKKIREGKNEYTNQGYTNDNQNYYQVEQLIRSHDYYTANVILNSMSNHNANWYYYSALANYGLHDIAKAKQHIDIACNLEPNNTEYRRIQYLISNQNNNIFGETRYNTSFHRFSFFGFLFKLMLFSTFIRFLFSFVMSLFAR